MLTVMTADRTVGRMVYDVLGEQVLIPEPDKIEANAELLQVYHSGTFRDGVLESGWVANQICSWAGDADSDGHSFAVASA